MSAYASFLARKRQAHSPCGLQSNGNLHSDLWDFQKYITAWALRLGCASVFADCGLGKTFIQLEWSRIISEHTGKPVLILAPLAVSTQTQREGKRFGYNVNICRSVDQVRPGINITNYEMLHAFTAHGLAGIVLDESSLLKSFTGSIRNQLIEIFGRTPFRLTCTATPSPNDHMELGNHSEFLGVMSRTAMLSTFFNHDGGETSTSKSKWRLKGHAQRPFWDWVSSWALMIRKPSDLGYSDEGYILPPLRHHLKIVNTEAQTGFLFPVEARDLGERRESRKASISTRVTECAGLIGQDKAQWLVWGDLNAETDAATDEIPGSVQVAGADTDEHKKSCFLDFADGRLKRLVTKPKIGGWGMNWQNCHKMIFLGPSDSHESRYQATRRCWRFGQKHPVDVYTFATDRDAAVLRNLERKQAQADEMSQEMVAALRRTHE